MFVSLSEDGMNQDKHSWINTEFGLLKFANNLFLLCFKIPLSSLTVLVYDFIN